MAAKPIIMTITNTAKNAMLDNQNLGITLRLNRLAIGSGRYTPTDNETQLASEISRHVITAGDIEPNTHTLRLFSVVTAEVETEVWELGLYDTENRLFAIASATDKPLFKVYPDIEYVGSFALKLDNFDTTKIQITPDPNGALSIVLMSQHLAHSNPHPQYLLRGGGVGTADDLISRIAALESRKIEPVSIGGLLVTTRNYTNSQEVHDGEGYGVWTRFAQGQVLLGVGSHTDMNNTTRSFTMLEQTGEYAHRLTVDEMPGHKHGYGRYGGVNGTGSAATADEPWEGEQSDGMTLATGGNQPHNNIQPSIGVGIWLRLPDNYVAPTYDIYWTNDAEGNNKVTEFTEADNIYLWIDAQNISGSYPIHDISVTATRFIDTDAQPQFYNSTVSPSAITNGKNLVYALNGNADGYFRSDVDLDVSIHFTDTAINQAKTLSASTVVRDTVKGSNEPLARNFEVVARYAFATYAGFIDTEYSINRKYLTQYFYDIQSNASNLVTNLTQNSKGQNILNITLPADITDMSQLTISNVDSAKGSMHYDEWVAQEGGKPVVITFDGASHVLSLNPEWDSGAAQSSNIQTSTIKISF